MKMNETQKFFYCCGTISISERKFCLVYANFIDFSFSSSYQICFNTYFACGNLVVVVVKLLQLKQVIDELTIAQVISDEIERFGHTT